MENEIEMTREEKEAVGKGYRDCKDALTCPECKGVGATKERFNEILCNHFCPPAGYEELYEGGWDAAVREGSEKRARFRKILSSGEFGNFINQQAKGEFK